MIHAQEVIDLHTSTVALWHKSPIENQFDGVLGIVCQQHQFNYQLWHQEDIARSPDCSDREIADVKRAIDKLNQLRNDWIERVDDWLSQYLVENNISASPNATQNSETPGSIVDRLSIIRAADLSLGRAT